MKTRTVANLFRENHYNGRNIEREHCEDEQYNECVLAQDWKPAHRIPSRAGEVEAVSSIYFTQSS
jgi:hypothetical protein